MKKQKEIIFILLFLLLSLKSSSQGFLITPPILEFDGNQLLISYDIINKNQADQFYVWVEMGKKNGEPIPIKNLSGDVGDNIKEGKNKKIIWVPEKDSIFLNEEVFVKVKAEKYTKSFNKGSAILLSTVIPGMGQTKINKGKPLWLTAIVAYGTMAGGYIAHKNYLRTYKSYLNEEDPLKRADLFTQSEKQLSISNALIISGMTLWITNIIWVALIPDKYGPLQHTKLALDPPTSVNFRTTSLKMRFNF